jgi:hypothetical protein
MRSLTTYDFPSITRNVSGRAWRWANGRKGHLRSLVFWPIRVPVGLALFWLSTALCGLALAFTMVFYFLSLLVVPKEHVRRAEWLNDV